MTARSKHEMAPLSVFQLGGPTKLNINLNGKVSKRARDNTAHMKIIAVTVMAGSTEVVHGK